MMLKKIYIFICVLAINTFWVQAQQFKATVPQQLNNADLAVPMQPAAKHIVITKSAGYYSQPQNGTDHASTLHINSNGAVHSYSGGSSAKIASSYVGRSRIGNEYATKSLSPSIKLASTTHDDDDVEIHTDVPTKRRNTGVIDAEEPVGEVPKYAAIIACLVFALYRNRKLKSQRS